MTIEWRLYLGGVASPVLAPWLRAVLAAAPDVVRPGQRGAAVQQDLDHLRSNSVMNTYHGKCCTIIYYDLVVVGVRRQDEGRDVRGEGGSVRRQRLPTLKIDAY